MLYYAVGVNTKCLLLYLEISHLGQSLRQSAERVRVYLNKSQTKGSVKMTNTFALTKWFGLDVLIVKMKVLQSNYQVSVLVIASVVDLKKLENDSMGQHERAKVCPYGHCMQEALEIMYGTWAENQKKGVDERKFKLAIRRLNRHFGRRR